MEDVCMGDEHYLGAHVAWDEHGTARPTTSNFPEPVVGNPPKRTQYVLQSFDDRLMIGC